MQLVDKNNEATPMLNYALRDIFRKFELSCNSELQFPEFEDFFNAIGFKITEDDFIT